MLAGFAGRDGAALHNRFKLGDLLHREAAQAPSRLTRSASAFLWGRTDWHGFFGKLAAGPSHHRALGSAVAQLCYATALACFFIHVQSVAPCDLPTCISPLASAISQSQCVAILREFAFRIASPSKRSIEATSSRLTCAGF